MSESPRVLLFTGDGKGKTTAALGMALRAAGHGIHALVLQFIKGDADTGEITAIGSLDNVDILQTGRGFLPPKESPSLCEHTEAAESGFTFAREAAMSGRYGLIVLDEICIAVARGLVDERDVLDLIRQLPDNSRLVLTGRYATPNLIQAADTVSEIACVKHAMDSGRPAQMGVER